MRMLNGLSEEDQSLLLECVHNPANRKNKLRDLRITFLFLVMKSGDNLGQYPNRQTIVDTLKSNHNQLAQYFEDISLYTARVEKESRSKMKRDTGYPVFYAASVKSSYKPDVPCFNFVDERCGG